MKNAIIGILLIVTVGSLLFGYTQYSKLEEAQANCASEKESLEKLAQEQQLQAREFQKMAEQAQQEAVIQRTICEEQIKSLRK
jgi:hypothetical protein